MDIRPVTSFLPGAIGTHKVRHRSPVCDYVRVCIQKHHYIFTPKGARPTSVLRDGRSFTSLLVAVSILTRQVDVEKFNCRRVDVRFWLVHLFTSVSRAFVSTPRLRDTCYSCLFATNSRELLVVHYRSSKCMHLQSIIARDPDCTGTTELYFIIYIFFFEKKNL